MKADVYNIDGTKSGNIELPSQFSEPLRKDLIQRAFLAIRANKRQAYGSYPTAGQRQSAKLSRRRRKFKGAYGKAISRAPRKTIWRRGSHFGWVGAFAPGTYKGRIAHPPKAYKILDEKINKKENRKAIRSALSAVINENIVKERGHLFKYLPLVIDNKLYDFKKTKDLVKFLEKLGLENELERIKEKNVRSGQGSKRNRKYRIKKGPLIVIGKKSQVSKILSSIRGLDCVLVNNINVELLAPGGNPGRLTLFTRDAIEEMQKSSLFLENRPKEKVQEKEITKKAPEKKQVDKKYVNEKTVKKVKAAK